jgi:hypothetical protein
MDAIEKFDSPGCFVRLQVTHEMPTRGGPTECCYFSLGFLHAILAKVCNAGLEPGPKSFGGMSLTNCD